jgi:hypothetical protein
VSLQTNTIKNNKTLGELSWTVQPPRDFADGRRDKLVR